MKSIKTRIVFLVSFLLSALALAQGNVKNPSVSVKTSSVQNNPLKVYYRIPANYKDDSKNLYRVLVIFGGRNCSGEKEVGGMLGFDKWADENDVFLVGPGFKDDEYWQPEKWSGKALIEALDEIGKNYKISKDHLLYYGYSAGSQCSNLFPAWKPQMCTAWVSHACGVFHKPEKKMKASFGLVTCGEADIGRYQISRNFVTEYRKLGVPILWKTFPNTQHDVPPDSVILSKVFLKYYHTENLSELESAKKESARKKVPEKKILYVGDDQENRFWPFGSRETLNIEPEDRVEFTSKELALAWGREAKPRIDTATAEPEPAKVKK